MSKFLPVYFDTNTRASSLLFWWGIFQIYTTKTKTSFIIGSLKPRSKNPPGNFIQRYIPRVQVTSVIFKSALEGDMLGPRRVIEYYFPSLYQLNKALVHMYIMFLPDTEFMWMGGLVLDRFPYNTATITHGMKIHRWSDTEQWKSQRLGRRFN